MVFVRAVAARDWEDFQFFLNFFENNLRADMNDIGDTFADVIA